MTSPASGYSGTPLPKKLGIGDATVFGTVNEPAEFVAALGSLPVGSHHSATLDECSVIIGFFTVRADLTNAWTMLTDAAGPFGAVWVAWPKKASKVPTDITEDVLRTDLLPTGWVDVKVCAIDAVWSGLKLVRRKELRPFP